MFTYKPKTVHSWFKRLVLKKPLFLKNEVCWLFIEERDGVEVWRKARVNKIREMAGQNYYWLKTVGRIDYSWIPGPHPESHLKKLKFTEK